MEDRRKKVLNKSDNTQVGNKDVEVVQTPSPNPEILKPVSDLSDIVNRMGKLTLQDSSDKKPVVPEKSIQKPPSTSALAMRPVKLFDGDDEDSSKITVNIPPSKQSLNVKNDESDTATSNGIEVAKCDSKTAN